MPDTQKQPEVKELDRNLSISACLLRRELNVGDKLSPGDEASGPGYARTRTTVGTVLSKGVDFPIGAREWGFLGWIGLLDDNEVIIACLNLRTQIRAVVTTKRGYNVAITIEREGNTFEIHFPSGASIVPGDFITLPMDLFNKLGLTNV